MNRRSLAAAALTALAAAALLSWAFAPRPIEVDLARADRGRFEETIDEDGRTRLRDRYLVSAPLAGRLARPTLREGDPIARDTVVALLAPTLSPMLDERTLRGQQARVAAAEAVVLRADAHVERMQVGLQQARNEVIRTEQLAQRGFVAPTKLEADRLAVSAAQKDLDAAEQDRHAAGHDLEQARAALVSVQRGGGPLPFELRSPIEGRVLKVVQASEGVVALGAPLLELGDTRRLEVLAELLTTDALRTRPGDRVSIERWGGPAPLEGVVRRIEPAAFTKVSALGIEEQRVNVLIDLTSPFEAWQALGDGFRVSVRIVVLAVDDAVRVPVSAVFPLPRADATGDGPAAPRWAVFTVRDGLVRQVPVETGGRNGVHAWLRSGLEPGETVVVYPPPALRDGARAKARG
ncbi:MAG: HlyD family efflux transporter periplasmic adaptor subunit [Burkholderiales bacterium]|nr:HlyD family efflux transporter periplasmic adaptor subunit [Burkholderiales bacterium]